MLGRALVTEKASQVAAAECLSLAHVVRDNQDKGKGSEGATELTHARPNFPYISSLAIISPESFCAAKFSAALG